MRAPAKREMSASTESAASGASAPPAVAGSARVMTSVPAARSAASAPGRPHQTIPAPARIAAWLTNIGAPVIPSDPPTTITAAIHLWAVGGRGERAATSAAS